jgi:hypothetical protein
MIMTYQQKLDKLERKAEEAEDNFQKAFVVWVKANNDFMEATPSAFDGLPYGVLFDRVFHMVKNSDPKEYSRDNLEKIHIVEQLEDGSFIPLFNRAKFKIF